VGPGAEIKDLGVMDVNVTGSGDYVGGLVGDKWSGTVTQCYSSGAVSGKDYVGGLVGWNRGSVTRCYSTGVVRGSATIGGLVGGNAPIDHQEVQPCGTVTECYSTTTVTGTTQVGGLVGGNPADPDIAWLVTDSFWDTQTSGQTTSAGGTGKTTVEMQTAKTFLDAGWDFVGETKNGTEDLWWILEGKVYPRLVWDFRSPWAFSPDPPDGTTDVIRSPTLSWRGGERAVQHDVYLGEDENTVANATSGSLGTYRGRQPTEMTTYDPGILDWGTTYYWRVDEVNEADPNGPWEGSVWSFTTTDCIKSPHPLDRASDVPQPVVLSWVPGGPGLQYDLYLGENQNDVASATPQTPGIYRGRQLVDLTTYDPGVLKLGKTYYWRVDGVDKADPQRPWKGTAWSFTTADFIVVSVADDFESYTDDMKAGQAIFQIWRDGLGYGSDPNDPNDPPPYAGNGIGSAAGNSQAPFAEHHIVHEGRQSMPMDYNNVKKPWYSEAQRTWATPQDWTINAADTLTLYFRGEARNGQDRLYVGIEDSGGRIAVVVHPDAGAVLATEWQKWHIALADVRAAGVDVAAVQKMVIGIGDRKNPKPGGAGRIYIDDIRLTKRMP